MMKRIIIASCRSNPVLSESNAAYVSALKEQGIFDVSVLAWNSDSIHEFAKSDLVVLRQTWDYQDDPGGFAAWISRLHRLGTMIESPHDIAIWNNDKRTLSEFSVAGVSIPKTVYLSPEMSWCDLEDMGSDKIVLKPAFGGSGVGVRICDSSNFEEQLSDARKESIGRPILAQEYLPEIADGELKMTCINGKVKFALLAIPKPGEFRINSRFQPITTIVQPPASAIAAAEQMLSWIGQVLLCSRIDGVMRGDEFICTEVELTDPDLHLHRVPNSAMELATATLEYMR